MGGVIRTASAVMAAASKAPTTEVRMLADDTISRADWLFDFSFPESAGAFDFFWSCTCFGFGCRSGCGASSTDCDWTTAGAATATGSGAGVGAAGAGVGAGAGTAVQVVTHGEQVHVPSETLLEFSLDQPLTLPAPMN